MRNIKTYEEIITHTYKLFEFDAQFEISSILICVQIWERYIIINNCDSYKAYKIICKELAVTQSEMQW